VGSIQGEKFIWAALAAFKGEAGMVVGPDEVWRWDAREARHSSDLSGKATG
jgi:hypothetical protein